MNQQSNAVIDLPYERMDVAMRDVVNHGISMQEDGNTVSAIEYLKARDVSPAVIERVLLNPQRRRHSANH